MVQIVPTAQCHYSLDSFKEKGGTVTDVTSDYEIAQECWFR